MFVKLDKQCVRVISSRDSRGSDPSRAGSAIEDSGGYKMIKEDKKCSLIPFTKLLSRQTSISSPSIEKLALCKISP